MLFALHEDGGVAALADLAAARREIEPYDAESGAVLFFDADGNPLTPQFPARSTRKILGLRVYDDPGPYELVRAAANVPTLRELLIRATYLEPNAWFATLDDLRVRFEAPPG